ncbi:MAG: IS21 family transposase [Thermoanaerobaculia bacterium]
MITPEDEALIVRLYHTERWRVGTIARQLGIHHGTVRRVLKKIGALRKEAPRPSLIDPYVPFLLDTLKSYPEVTAARLHAMVKERGYAGAADHFRHLIADLRPPPPAEAYLRLKTLPGEEAQADWGHFGTLQVGKATRPLWGFVMTLSYSRRIFLRFYPGASMAYFLDGHVGAFETWAGSPRVVLYDNLKSVVLERVREAIRFHPEILRLAAHYRFEPRPVAVARGNEKGRVERAIRYIRGAFFKARPWRDLEDLNLQAKAWSEGESLERRWPEDRTLSVREAFAVERPKLLGLPGDLFPVEERREVAVGKTPYVRFDLNDYSVPPERVRRTLVVLATLAEVRIVDESEVVARHPRSYDREERIEDREHLERLVEAKRAAHKSRGIDRLARAAPSTEELLSRMARRGTPLGYPVRVLLELLDTYGAAELETGVVEALANDVPHPHAVRHLIEKKRKREGQGPCLPLPLPPDPRLREITVTPASLKPYDLLKERGDDQEPA